MSTVAKLTSKGQITIPKSVRDALGLKEGDHVHFHVEKGYAVVARTPDFIGLAGSVAVPPSLRGADFDEIREQAWRSRGAEIA